MIRPFNFGKSEGKSRSSKIGIFVGFAVLAFIVGSLFLNEVKKNPFKDIKSLKPVQSKVKLPPYTTQILKQAQGQAGIIGRAVFSFGEKTGAAILGESVKFVEKNASKSASVAASAAANLVIKTAVPGIVDQVNKLPADQKKQVKEYLCK